MKKTKLIILCLFILFLLTGCKNDIIINKTKYTNEKVNISTEQSPTPLPVKKNLTTFSTKIYDTSQGRMNNLNVAAKKLSNTIIKSGETFSFNNTMGPSSKQNGYKKAKIFDANGNVLKEYGGGICQISTTLYNAALNLNLEIIERNNHSKKVQYIEPGKDAAISYGHLDLKFKNTLNYDIIIQCKIENNKVIVDIEKKD